MNYPEYAEVDNEKYKINTDFRVAIECDKIAKDETIGDYERALAIIYLLFGDKGLNTTEHHSKLLELALKYLACGEEIKDKKQQKQDMDYEQDYKLIWASIYGEYNSLDIDKENIHWWKFMNLLNNLSNSELGNCCVLNRIRNLRNMEPKEIKDSKERKRIIDLQKEYALKTKTKERKKPTEKEKKSAIEFLEKLQKGKE